jgi:prophage DNA circulation protein
VSAFDQLQTASFAGYAFPWSRLKVSCSLRDHVHVYPHAPGGQPEKLGRNLYEFHFTCPFHGTLPKYPKLWPETLASLRVIFEGGRSFDLVVPTIGTITAYCVKWDEDADARHRSGVATEFAFREDASELFLVTEIIAARTAATFAARQTLDKRVSDAGLTDSAFAKLSAAVTALEQVKDQFEIAAYAVASKAESVVALANRVASLPVLDDPRNYLVLDAVREVHFSALRLLLDAGKATGKVVVPHTVPTTMPVSLVSKAIYGDTTHSLEILRLNAIPDALAIPGGTQLRVYAPAPLLAAA